jgi:hypothetical protein
MIKAILRKTKKDGNYVVMLTGTEYSTQYFNNLKSLFDFMWLLVEDYKYGWGEFPFVKIDTFYSTTEFFVDLRDPDSADRFYKHVERAFSECCAEE